MKRWPVYVFFGLVFYLLFLVIQMPASWFAWGVNHYTQGSVRLDPLSGNLWGGSGRLVIYHPKTTPHDFGRTTWHINPLWLAAGRIQLSVHSEQPQQNIKTTLGIARNRLILQNTRAEVPAELVAQLYPPAALIAPEGRIGVSADGLEIEPKALTGALTLEWRNAGSRLTSVQPLGNYRLDVAADGKSAKLKLNTLQGALVLDAQGQWTLPGGDIRLAGNAYARERAGELEGLLRLFGTDQGNGRRSFVFNGRLPLAFGDTR